MEGVANSKLTLKYSNASPNTAAFRSLAAEPYLSLSDPFLSTGPSYAVYEGRQCSGDYTLRTMQRITSNPDVCKAACTARSTCSGFVHVLAQTPSDEPMGWRMTCYFRSGALTNPTTYRRDQRNCYVKIPGQFFFSLFFLYWSSLANISASGSHPYGEPRVDGAHSVLSSHGTTA